MSADLVLQPVSEKGWVLGLRTLLGKENHAWWGTRRWWMQALIWLLGLNGLVALVAFVLPLVAVQMQGQLPEDFDPLLVGMQSLFQLGALALAVGAVVLAQGSVQEEIESGTAAWVLSKPVSRASFLLSKLIAHALGVLVLLVGLQSAVAYGLLSLRAGAFLPLGPFLVAVSGLALHTLFYLALTILLGVFFQSRGAVLGGALGCLLGGSVLAALIPPLAAVPPWSMPGMLPALAAGYPVPATLVASSLAVLGAMFLVAVGVSVYRFQQIEF